MSRPYVDRLRDAGIRVTVQAGTVEEARRAEAAGADFVVARGAEGGGHGRNDVGTLPLLQAVLEAVDVPVVAAGGIGTARGLAAVLAAGAAGAWVGTALLTAREAGTPAAARRGCWLAGEVTGTAYGRVFDVAQRLGWPEEFGGRALRNAFFDRWEHRLDELATDDAASGAGGVRVRRTGRRAAHRGAQRRRRARGAGDGGGPAAEVLGAQPAAGGKPPVAIGPQRSTVIRISDLSCVRIASRYSSQSGCSPEMQRK